MGHHLGVGVILRLAGGKKKTNQQERYKVPEVGLNEIYYQIYLVMTRGFDRILSLIITVTRYTPGS